MVRSRVRWNRLPQLLGSSRNKATAAVVEKPQTDRVGRSRVWRITSGGNVHWRRPGSGQATRLGICDTRCKKACRLEAKGPALKSSMQRRGVFGERGQQPVSTLHATREGMHRTPSIARLCCHGVFTTFMYWRAGIGRGHRELIVRCGCLVP
jgi:hypothetical protein